MYHNSESVNSHYRDMEMSVIGPNTRKTLSDYKYAPLSPPQQQQWQQHQHQQQSQPIGPYNSTSRLWPEERQFAQNSIHNSNSCTLNNNGHCDVANCGKLLWISRDLYKSRSSPSLVPDPSGRSYQENMDYSIRTGQRVQPFTPQPSQRQSFLANQSAINTALPLVLRHGRNSTTCKTTMHTYICTLIQSCIHTYIHVTFYCTSMQITDCLPFNAIPLQGGQSALLNHIPPKADAQWSQIYILEIIL